MDVASNSQADNHTEKFIFRVRQFDKFLLHWWLDQLGWKARERRDEE